MGLAGPKPKGHEPQAVGARRLHHIVQPGQHKTVALHGGRLCHGGRRVSSHGGIVATSRCAVLKQSDMERCDTPDARDSGPCDNPPGISSQIQGLGQRTYAQIWSIMTPGTTADCNLPKNLANALSR